MLSQFYYAEGRKGPDNHTPVYIVSHLPSEGYEDILYSNTAVSPPLSKQRFLFYQAASDRVELVVPHYIR